MNLGNMATFVCGKINQSETEDITACKGFLQRRHEMIWNDQLFKDSLVEYTQSLSPSGYTVSSNWLPTLGVLMLPPAIQRVLAVRTDTRKLNIQRPEFYYRIDYDSFSKTGTEYEYVLLPPCVWQTQTPKNLYVARYSSDSGSEITADILDSDGVGITRVQDESSLDFISIGETSEIESFLKLESSSPFYIVSDEASVTIDGAGSAGGNGTAVLNGAFNGRPFYGDTTAQGSLPLSTPHDLAVMWTGSEWRIVGMRGIFYETLYLSSEDVPFPGLVETWEVVSGFAPVPTSSGSGTILTIGATDTSGKKRQRIRLVVIPSASLTIRVLGKRAVPTFSDDNDEPSISGVENCLLAFAQADMLQRIRQYGKSASIAQEALALLEQLKKQEVVQQAHYQRIIPEDGYGNPMDTYSSPLTF